MGKVVSLFWLVAMGAVLAMSPVLAMDERTAINVTPEERNVLLAQMRKMQETVQGILLGVNSNNMADVAKAAAASGPMMMMSLPMTIRKKFPEEFKGLGMSAHKGFAGIAKAAKSGANKEKILSMLSDNYGVCITCHSVYQFK